MTLPKISVIILNWNSIDDTKECLDSLKKVTYPNFDVIVVDNASSGPDVEILIDEFSGFVTVIANKENLGFPEGNNVGIRHALQGGSDCCLLLNNDTIVDPEFLTELEVTARDPTVGIVGSKIYNYYLPRRIDSTGGRAWYWLMLLKNQGLEEDHGQYELTEERDFVYANSMLVKREVLEKIGVLDPYFFYGVEEYDFCIRVRRGGYRIVYAPKSKIWHKSGRCRAKLTEHPETARLIKERMGFLSYKYIYRLSRKHFPPVLFVIPFTAYYVGLAVPLLLGGSPITAIRYIVKHRDYKPVLAEAKSKWLSRLNRAKD